MSVDVKSRDVRKELDLNDPLMELTRIMGFPPSEHGVQKQADPQLIIEDDFSLDLERELEIDEAAEIDRRDAEFALDDDLAANFDNELSQSLKMGEDTPNDMPSLEDELEALLASEPSKEVTLGGAHDLGSFSDDELTADFDAAFNLDEDFEIAPVMEREAWPQVIPESSQLAPNLQENSGQFEVASVGDEDPILYQMNRMFGRSNLTAHAPKKEPNPIIAEMSDLDLSTDEVELSNEAYIADFSLDEAFLDGNDGTQHDNMVASTQDKVSVQAATHVSYELGLQRLVSKTEVEPIVEATEFAPESISAMDTLDIPELPTHISAPKSMNYDLDDEYQGYESPVLPQSSAKHQSVELEDFSIDLPHMGDDSDLDFESILNDELNASVEDHDNDYGYEAGPAAASAAVNKSQGHAQRKDIPRSDEMIANYDEAPSSLKKMNSSRNNWLVAATIGAVAVLGVGYYALSGPSTGYSDNAPVLVKADPNPVKVAPETPGGKTVANQDLALYDKVGGEDTVLPTQGQLVSESEEPVDIASVPTKKVDDSNAKSDERIDPALDVVASGQSADTIAISPKKVRTMIVKPDGTLVERPAEPVPEVAAAAATTRPDDAPEVPAQNEPSAATETTAQSPAPQVESPVAASENEANSDVPATETLAEVADIAVETPKVTTPAIKVVKAKKVKAPAVDIADEAQSSETGAAPVLDQRPADQPVTIVGQTGQSEPASETQVALAEPVVEAAPLGSYSMQIASTPSAEAAKSTYAALSRKFGGVLGGRGVNVQKAEVDGKGTVYRLRIPAGSKQEASALCQQYKSAGGNCFITK